MIYDQLQLPKRESAPVNEAQVQAIISRLIQVAFVDGQCESVAAYPALCVAQLFALLSLLVECYTGGFWGWVRVGMYWLREKILDSYTKVSLVPTTLARGGFTQARTHAILVGPRQEPESPGAIESQRIYET